ncbi:MAG: ATP-binding protein [Candidatus Wallbacteria bacterium]|nr:ATP-binding protein [Candidatus Wallbacteria bacterium]
MKNLQNLLEGLEKNDLLVSRRLKLFIDASGLPFASDLEYTEARVFPMEVLESCQKYCNYIYRQSDGEATNLEDFTPFCEQLEEIIAAREELSSKAGFVPRLFYFCGNSGISKQEQALFLYAVFKARSGSRTFSLRDFLNAFRFNRDLQANIPEDSRLFKLSVIEIESGTEKKFLEQVYSLHPVSLKVFYGQKLSDSETVEAAGLGMLEAMGIEGGDIAREVREMGNDEEKLFLPGIGDDSAPEFKLSDLTIEEDENPLEDSTDEDKAIRSDIEYLEESFKWLLLRMQATGFVRDMAENPVSLRLKEKRQRRMINYRVRKGGHTPRFQKLSRMLHLSLFEQYMIMYLAGKCISSEIREMANSLYSARNTTVDEIGRLFCGTLAEKLSLKKYFTNTSVLIKNSVIHFESDNEGFFAGTIALDSRVLEYLMGMEIKVEDYVAGSRLFAPEVKLENVIIPDEQKKKILEIVETYPRWLKERDKFHFNEVISYGKALVLLFHGPSGTGKTMAAYGIAGRLKKKMLLVNYATLSSRSRRGGDRNETLPFVFREARFADAILFIDECEELIRDGECRNMLLTEFEKFEGIVIMATNQPNSFDPPIQRRISLTMKFERPSVSLREQIWKVHMPEAMKLAPDVDFKELAGSFDLTGGLIKNAVLAALSSAVRRKGKSVTLRMEDLEYGAKLQLLNLMSFSDFANKLTPRFGLESLILDGRTARSVRDLIGSLRVIKIMRNEWGFGERHPFSGGCTVLFHGHPGTGKTLSAEAIGFELGKPLKVVNMAQLVSCWVGETSKHIESVFADAEANDAILLFDEADALFSSRTALHSATDRYANQDVGVLLRKIETTNLIVILTTNLLFNIDKAFLRRFNFVLEFPRPAVVERELLWKSLIPEKTPLDAGVNFRKLAESYEFTGGEIRKAVTSAAVRAGQREGATRRITESDLREASCEILNAMIKENRVGFIGEGA